LFDRTTVLQTKIVRDDGVAGLFRGGGPTVVRAMALNMGMLASNDQAKEMIEAAGFTKGGSVAVLGGATIAGGCCWLVGFGLITCG
jgi:solute carrier family 25 oxoglutarate transporter 11